MSTRTELYVGGQGRNPRASFTHQLRGEFVVVIDLCEHYRGMSVTNDAENVVDYLIQCYGPRRIIYRDTEGVWDELEHNGMEFTNFKPLPACFTIEE